MTGHYEDGHDVAQSLTVPRLVSEDPNGRRKRAAGTRAVRLGWEASDGAAAQSWQSAWLDGCLSVVDVFSQ
jgi:hypothetical protein